MYMALFKNVFTTLLEQDDKIEPPTDTPEGESPLEGELEPGTTPDQLGAAVDPGQDIESLKQQSIESQKAELTGWIARLEEFKSFINDPNADSIQVKLQSASCDSLFEKIASSEHKRLSRVAMEISAIIEAFRGYQNAND
jgi:hypothetical protein